MVKISVVIPVYNVEHCIDKTISSLLNQSFKDFELVLIDDGSKDKSIFIAENILNKSNIKFSIFKQENSGVSSARNYGIKAANGEFICFLDSDDYVEKEYLMKVYNKFKACNCDMVYCNYRQINENGKIISENCINTVSNLSSIGKEVTKEMLKDKVAIWIGATIYKKCILEENNIFFDNNRKYAEDVVFIVKALLNSNVVGYINDPMVNYVRWEGSVTNTFSLKHIDCYESYKDLLEYVTNFHKEKEIESILKKYKLPYAICHIYLVLSKNPEFRQYLIEFLQKDEIRDVLKEAKIIEVNKLFVKYYFLSKILLFNKFLIT